MAKSRLHELSEHGVSVWIDSLSREWLEDGVLAQLMREDAVVGVTSNPTIFQKAMARRATATTSSCASVAAARGRPDRDLLRARRSRTSSDACDLLRPVWDEGGGQDGYVSLEVDPTLAYDRERTLEQALRFHEEVDRPNLFVKIPATEPGLGAIEDCDRAGAGRSTSRSSSRSTATAPVVEAYLRGLERLVEAGGDPSRVASVASFFVSRVDTEADKRLEATRQHRAPGQARDREREARLPALPRGVRRRALGARSRRRARRSSAASGPRPRRRTRPTATCSTSRS